MKPCPSRRRGATSAGFTLLELMVVIAIVALASLGVGLSLRDNDAQALENEALRLSALLESARAQSRSSGVAIFWRPSAEGFEFVGLPDRAPASADSLGGARGWLHGDTRAQIVLPGGANRLVLGPEPLIAAQRVQLRHGERALTLATDGLAPFAPLE